MRLNETQYTLVRMERDIEKLTRRVRQAEQAHNYVKLLQYKQDLEDAQDLYEEYKANISKNVTSLIPNYEDRCKLSNQVLLLMTVADLFVDVYNDTHDVMKQALGEDWDVVVLEELQPAIEPIRKSVSILGGFGDALAEHFSAMTDVITPQIKAYIDRKIKPYRSGKVRAK